MDELNLGDLLIGLLVLIPFTFLFKSKTKPSKCEAQEHFNKHFDELVSDEHCHPRREDKPVEESETEKKSANYWHYWMKSIILVLSLGLLK